MLLQFGVQIFFNKTVMHQLKGCSHKPRPYISSISDTVSSFGIIIIVFCIKVFIIQPFEVQTTNFVFTLTHTQWTLCYWVWCFLLWGSNNKPLTCIYNAVKKYLPLSDFFFFWCIFVTLTRLTSDNLSKNKTLFRRWFYLCKWGKKLRGGWIICD